MANRYSVATIKEPEFLNITPYNPLISKCEIKVLYTGKNDNGTDISKETATKMANTLPGCPIVGAYNKEKADFSDHGDVIVIEDGEIKTSCKTVPYGFVAPDSKIWFKEYDEENRDGEIVRREYLMCEGYLWTGQYGETKRILDKGNGQSMELDKNSLKGHWSEEENSYLDFFIISDAIFSKLCILGENVEPCFEGASITAPDISQKFSLDTNLTNSLYTMMNELKFALEHQNKGGQELMPGTNNNQNININVNDAGVETQTSQASYTNNNDGSGINNGVSNYSLNDIPEYQELSNNYALLKTENETLKAENEKLKNDNQALTNFKLEVEKNKKQEMIDSFYMLSDADKKDVIDNIYKYSVDEIESKLSVICVRNKVNFNLDNNSNSNNNIEEQVPELTYNLNQNTDSSTPVWLKTVLDRRKDV